MKVFTIECKDTKTGLSMVLSECTYNMACDWLDRKLKNYGVEICKCVHNNKTNFDEIWTARFDDELNNYVPCRKYFYDEERGYLLGE